MNGRAIIAPSTCVDGLAALRRWWRSAVAGQGLGAKTGLLGSPTVAVSGGGAGELSAIVDGIQVCGPKPAVSGLGQPAGGGGGGQGFEQGWRKWSRVKCGCG